MHCSRCRSPMIQTRRVTGQLSHQEWYECPDCHRASVCSVSEPRTGHGVAAARRVFTSAPAAEAT